MAEWLSEWRAPVATAAAATTVLQFLAGSLVCRKFISKGSTGEASGFPFVCGFLSCSLWLRYGWLKDDGTVILVNMIGCSLLFIYILLYYRYVMKKSLIVYQFLIVLSIIGLLFGYTVYESDKKLSLARMGMISCVVTILFIAAPLTMLVHVVRVRSTETLPFPMISMSFLVSGLWYFYGVIIDDTFMKIPNAIGAILSVAQLSLFVIYPSTSSVSYTKLNQAI